MLDRQSTRFTHKHNKLQDTLYFMERYYHRNLAEKPDQNQLISFSILDSWGFKYGDELVVDQYEDGSTTIGMRRGGEE